MSFNANLNRLLRRYGHGSLRAARLAGTLSGLTAEERDFISEMGELRRVGRSLNDLQSLRAAEILSRLVPQYRVRMLLSPTENAFIVPGLQEIFLRETSHLAEPPSITQWIRQLRTGSEAYGILFWLCGHNFATQATLSQGLGTRLLSFFSIAAPSEMAIPTERALADMMAVPGARSLLFDRMRVLFDANRGSAALVASGRISTGHFSVLKGNAAELLAREAVMDTFRRGAAFGSLPEGAVFVSGVRLRRPGMRNSVLFSDGLVGVIDGDSWRWFGKLEVKSYDAGFSDGVEQVVRLGDVSNMTSAFTLELPPGALIIRISDNNVQTVSRRMSFAFDPARAADLNRVTIPSEGIGNLVVAPLGTSRFDLAQLTPPARVAAGRVVQIMHPMNTAAIDHLTAIVLQTVSGQSSIEGALNAMSTWSSGLDF